MSLPFNLFASPGLGTTLSSQQFISLTPTRSINTNQSQLHVNAATGNVVVQDTEFELQDDGINLNYVNNIV